MLSTVEMRKAPKSLNFEGMRQLLLRMDQWLLHRIQPGFAYDQ